MKNKNIGYLINGCKTAFRTWELPGVQLGMRLLAIAFSIATLNGLLFLLAIIMPVVGVDYTKLGVVAKPKGKKGLRIRLNTKGLTGDNKKLYTDISKRVKLVGEPEIKHDPNEVIKAVRATLSKAGLGKKTRDAITDLLQDGEKGVRGIIKSMGAKITELETQLKQTSIEKKEPSVREQVRAWQKKNKEAIKQIRAGHTVQLSPLKIRGVRAANIPMTPANTLTSSVAGYNNLITNFEIESGLNEPVRRSPTLWDYLVKGATNAAAYFWVNKVVPNGSGAADFIAPGVLKPGISFELKVEVSNAKKIAVRDKVVTELLEDVDGMTSYIEQELKYQLLDHVNEQVAVGVSSSTDINGLRTLSVGFSASGLETPNPNNWDCIRAGAAQMSSGNLKGAITAFINPIDKANMDMTKAINDGQRFMPGDVGATIVEDNNVPVGYVQLAMLQYYTIKIYKGYTVNWGWENDDFSKNMITSIGEMRLHQYFKNQYTGAFIYDTFANIKAGIAQA